MIFRIYHKTVGGHVHMRFFAGRNDGALGKCGDLVMRTEEFLEFANRIIMMSPGPFGDRLQVIEFRQEDDGT